MGTVNLLNASVNGKLGQVYGTKQWGNHYLKAIPFSHTPHNEKQNQSFSAFQKLVRFSSGIAKDFKEYLPIKTALMTAANATAQLFKPIIKNKSFNIDYLEDVIVADGSTVIKSFDINFETSQVFLEVSTTGNVDKKNKNVWVIVIFDDLGRVLKTIVPNEIIVSGFIPLKLEIDRTYSVIAFRSDKSTKGQKLHGLSIRILDYIVNGYLNIDAFPTQENYSMVDEYLNINDETVTISDEYLVINI